MTKFRRNRTVCVSQILRAAAVAAPALFALTNRALGASLSWDPGMSTGGSLGGTNNWDSTSSFWYDGANDVLWSDGSDATFAGAVGTVTLTAPHTANGLSFTTGGYTLAGTSANPLTLSGAATVAVGSGLATTISGMMTGTSALLMNGPGTLVLNNSNNNWTGGTSVAGGTLTVGASNSLPASTVVRMANGASNVLNIPAGVTQQVAQLTGLVTAQDAGAVTLNGTLTVGDSTEIYDYNTMTGSSTGVFEKVGSGVLRVPLVVNAFAGTMKISGGTLYSSTLSSGSLVFGGLGNDTGSFSTLEFNGGTFRMDVQGGNGLGTMARPIVVDSTGGTIDCNTIDPVNGASVRGVTFSGSVTGNGTLTLTRSQTTNAQYRGGVYLNGAKAFSGAIVVNGTGLGLNNASSAGDNIQNDGTPNKITLGPAAAGNATMSFIAINSNITISHPIFIDPGAVAVRIGLSSGTQDIINCPSTALDIPSGVSLVSITNNGGTLGLTYAGEITGSGTFARGGLMSATGSFPADTARDRGTVLLTHDNPNFTGPFTVINDGTLRVGTLGTLGNATATASITLDRSGALTTTTALASLRPIVVGSTAVNENTGGTLDSNGVNSSWGDLLTRGSTGVFNKSTISNTLSAGTVTFTSINPAHNTLTVSNVGGTIAIAPNASTASVINTLSLGDITAKIDLTNNKLIMPSPNTTGVASGAGVYPTGTVNRLVHDGRNTGNWDGEGIVTSQSYANSANQITTLGVATAADALGLTSGTMSWNGQTVVPTDVLIKYTYAGDANLSGRIDADDYFQIDSHYNKSGNGLASGSGFFNGDFNYDGKINGDDYALIDQNFPNVFGTLGSLPPGGVSAVPEPGSISLLGVVAAAFIGRRRRK